MPFRENVDASWRPMICRQQDLILSFANIDCTLPCEAMVGQETTKKWLQAIEEIVVAGADRSNWNLDSVKKGTRVSIVCIVPRRGEGGASPAPTNP